MCVITGKVCHSGVGYTAIIVALMHCDLLAAKGNCSCSDCWDVPDIAFYRLSLLDTLPLSCVDCAFCSDQSRVGMFSGDD